MEHSTPRPLSTSGSGSGGFLSQHPEWQLLILAQLSLELNAELQYQNDLIHLTTVSPVRDHEMREMRAISSNLKTLVQGLKKQAGDAANAAHSEGQRALENIQKVNSFTTELKDSNTEIEQVLGEIGSNFPPSGEESHPDLNGVTLNKDK